MYNMIIIFLNYTAVMQIVSQDYCRFVKHFIGHLEYNINIQSLQLLLI